MFYLYCSYLIFLVSSLFCIFVQINAKNLIFLHDFSNLSLKIHTICIFIYSSLDNRVISRSKAIQIDKSTMREDFIIDVRRKVLWIRKNNIFYYQCQIRNEPEEKKKICWSATSPPSLNLRWTFAEHSSSCDSTGLIAFNKRAGLPLDIMEQN